MRESKNNEDWTLVKKIWTALIILTSSLSVVSYPLLTVHHLSSTVDAMLRILTLLCGLGLMSIILITYYQRKHHPKDSSNHLARISIAMRIYSLTAPIFFLFKMTTVGTIIIPSILLFLYSVYGYMKSCDHMSF